MLAFSCKPEPVPGGLHAACATPFWQLSPEVLVQSPAAPCPDRSLPLQVVPGGGSSDIFISFTPLVIPDTEAELCCDALLLGFMSLDSKVS